MSPSPLPKVNPERESPPWPSRKARPRAGRRRRKKISRYRDRAASSLPLVKKFRGLSGDGSGPKLSLAEFVRGAWHVLEPKTELTWSWHLDIICDVLERVTAGELNRVCINIPPGHMKSLLVSVFWPAWEWTRDPSIRYMTAANAGDLATRDAVRTRQLIEDEWYQEKWGDTVRLAKDQNAKTYFLNTRTGSRRSTSVGAKSTGHRADRLIIDDALTAMDVRFPNRRKHAQDWYRTEFASRLNDAQKSAIVIIGQRLHHDDLFGYIEEYEPEFEWVVLPTEFEPENQLSTCIEDPRTEKGELLFPERMGEAEVEQAKRTLGSYGYASQHQQRPVPQEGGILKAKWWKHYQKRPLELERLVLSVDCSFKKTTDGSFVVMQVWGTLGTNFYLIDQTRARLAFTDTITNIARMLIMYPTIQGVYVEEKANGAAVMDVLEDKVAGLVPVNPQGSKESRAEAITPLLEAGNVWIPDPDLYAWVAEFVSECTNFPNGKNDDQVDALTMALLQLRKATPDSLFWWASK